MATIEQRELQSIVVLGTATVFALGFIAGCLWSRRKPGEQEEAPVAAEEGSATLQTLLLPNSGAVPPLSLSGGDSLASSPRTTRSSVAGTPRATASKLVLVVRTDIDLGFNKSLVYSSQAAIGWFKKSYLRRYPVLQEWEHEGSCKLCYAATSDADVATVRARAKEANLICMGVAHVGPPAAKFMVAVGPVPSHLVSDLVKGLEALP